MNATFRPIMVLPQNHPVRPPVMVVPPSKQFRLSSAAVQQTLSRQIDAWFAHAHRAHAAPRNAEQFPSVDVTPKNEFGVRRTAYDVNGQLWVKCSPVVANAQPTWFHLGRINVA